MRFGKKLAVMLLALSANVAFGSGIEYFEAISAWGYKGSCQRVENNENDLIREGHLKHIFEAQDKAKSDCELATGKVCAVLSWGGKNIQDGCVGTAKAVVIAQ